MEKGPNKKSAKDFASRGNYLGMTRGNDHPWCLDLRTQLERHARWLRTVILARSGADGQAVEDLYQEVALAAVQNRTPFTDVAQIGPWLYQTAVRQSLQYRRQLGRRKRRETRAAETQQARAVSRAAQANPLAWLLLQERRAFVQQALTLLGPKDREILLLKYTEDWSYQQLAHHLGITSSAVESRLQRAREKLRRELSRTSPELA